MDFQNKEIMNIILNNLDIIGQGSQGICYHNKKTKEVRESGKNTPLMLCSL